MTEIWQTYTVLADIAQQQGDPEQARSYRRLARETYAELAGTLYEYRRVTLIVAVVAATVYLEYRAELETYLEEATRPEPGNLITAIRRVLDGERDEDALDKRLDLDGSIIIHTILAGIENPDTLRELLAEQPDYARWFRLQWRKKERAGHANPAP